LFRVAQRRNHCCHNMLMTAICHLCPLWLFVSNLPPLPCLALRLGGMWSSCIIHILEWTPLATESSQEQMIPSDSILLKNKVSEGRWLLGGE
jgi:hypothetical protein